jgi:tetratricopeptide (TPR) repeat protein
VPGALEAYRGAVAKAEARAAREPQEALAFALAEPRAQRLAARALGQGPSVGVARYRAALAQYLTDRGRWAEALREWDVVIAASSEDSLAHFSRGMVLDGLGARDQALEAYRRAVALDGRSVRFRLRLAQSLWQVEQYHQAMNEWRTVIGQEPGNLEARLALARVHLQLGERVEAVRQYERVLQIAPAHPEARQAFVRLGGILPR